MKIKIENLYIIKSAKLLVSQNCKYNPLMKKKTTEKIQINQNFFFKKAITKRHFF